MGKIAVLCADTLSNYFSVPDNLDIYTIERPAALFTGSDPVICHPPCAQWSKMRGFANFSRPDLDVAALCVEKLKANGGILEHPSGSTLFKHFGLKVNYSVDQSWFGFPARKRTYLACIGVKLVSAPFPSQVPDKTVASINSRMRSRMPLAFCQFLVDSVKCSFGMRYQYEAYEMHPKII